MSKAPLQRLYVDFADADNGDTRKTVYGQQQARQAIREWLDNVTILDNWTGATVFIADDRDERDRQWDIAAEEYEASKRRRH